MKALSVQPFGLHGRTKSKVTQYELYVIVLIVSQHNINKSHPFFSLVEKPAWIARMCLCLTCHHSYVCIFAWTYTHDHR